MKDNIKAVLLFMWILITLLMLVTIYAQSKNNKQLIYDLNVSQTAFKIQKSTLQRVIDENQMLRQANECLITYSYRDRCITAIKHTPLPKLEMR